MDTTAQVEKFLRDTRRVNLREIILGFLAILFVGAMMLVFAFITNEAPIGSLKFYGFLIVILGIVFNIGIMWSVASPRGNLNSHPPSDVEHWGTEMMRRGKLLRLVPVWGVGPFLPGLVLLLWPNDKVDVQDVLVYSLTIALLLLVFGVVIWLNIRAASKLEQQARALKNT